MMYLVKWQRFSNHVRAKLYCGTKRGHLRWCGEFNFPNGKDWNLFTQALRSTEDATVIYEEGDYTDV